MYLYQTVRYVKIEGGHYYLTLLLDPLAPPTLSRMTCGRISLGVEA